MILINRLKGNSLIISIYICESIICSMIAHFVPIPNISVILMIVLVIISFMLNSKINTSKVKNMLIPWSIIQLLLIVSGIINGFSTILNYWVYFTVFGTTAAIVIANEFDVVKVCKYITIIQTLYLLVYFIFIRRSFLNSGEDYYADSMGMAYAMTTIIYLTIVYHFYKKVINLGKMIRKLLYMDSLLSLFIILVDCRSRGPILVIIIATIVIFLSQSKGIKKIGFVIAGGISTFLIVYNFWDIVIFIYELLKRYNIEFSFVNKIIYLKKTDIGLMNGRNELYEAAITEIMKKPIIGHGIGYYETLGLGYVHNIFLDILLCFGIIGVIIVTIMFFACVRRVFRKYNQDRIASFFLLFFIGELMLNFSSSMWLYPCFWLMFFGLINLSNANKNSILDKDLRKIFTLETKNC